MHSNLAEWIFKACVLVTLAFLLSRTQLAKALLQPRRSLRDEAVLCVLFGLLGLAELKFTGDELLNLRIVAVVAAGLIAGPRVGVVIGVVITMLATQLDSGHWVSVGISMVLGGFFAGWLHRTRPHSASLPATGFWVGVIISGFRDLMILLFEHGQTNFETVGRCAILQGASAALVLFVLEQARQQRLQAKAAAMAEVRALQARMNPHFLSNSLNLVAALSELDPDAVPKATARLDRFLRAAIDQDDRAYVSLREEMDVVEAYLEIEAMRMGDRLEAKFAIDPRLWHAQVPPFLLQPLVENAIRHGIQKQTEGGRVWIWARESEGRLILIVADDGLGFASDTTCDGHAHALALLRRRMEGLFGQSFQMSIARLIESGTMVRVEIPLVVAEVLKS